MLPDDNICLRRKVEAKKKKPTRTPKKPQLQSVRKIDLSDAASIY